MVNQSPTFPVNSSNAILLAVGSEAVTGQPPSIICPLDPMALETYPTGGARKFVTLVAIPDGVMT